MGRDAELAAIVERWINAAAGAGATLVIRGEPGIGKSRLAAEAATLVAAQGGRVLTGATAAHEARPYQAVIEALRAALPTLVAAGDDATFLAPLASLIPNTPYSGRPAAFRPGKMRPASERAYSTRPLRRSRILARVRPLLLILEDVQWAGGATIDLIEMQARRAPGIALLVVPWSHEAVPFYLRAARHAASSTRMATCSRSRAARLNSPTATAYVSICTHWKRRQRAGWASATCGSPRAQRC